MSTHEPCVLAIDLGTSGPKTAVVSASGVIHALGRAQVETFHLPDGGAEQDPAAVWEAVKHAAREAVGLSGVSAARIEAVLCSSQFASIIPVGKDGEAVMNMVLWVDRRGATARLKQLPGYPRFSGDLLRLPAWVYRHGLAPIGTGDDSLAKMRWIKHARPEIYERTATFLEPMDFVALRLTGRAAANQCTALMLLTVNNRRINQTQHDPVLVRYSGIDAAKLPDILPLDAEVGTLLPAVAADLGLSPKTRVFTGMNDTQAGAMGAAAFTGSHASLSIGSTGCICAHVPFKRTDIRHALVSIPSPAPDTWFLMGENGIAGLAAEHFLTKLVFADDAFGALSPSGRFEALGRAVLDSPPGAHGALFMPWLNGALAPAAEPCMRGGLINLSVNTTRSDLARAVLEGVAMNLRWLRNHSENFARRAFSHFVFHGGGAESDAWAQILADVLGAPIHQHRHPRHVPCFGDALLALHRLGHVSLDDAARFVPIKQIYVPKREHAKVYNDLFPQFVAAFHRNRPIFRAMNAFNKK